MIKLFVTDMDGTFLRADKTYDKAHFLRLFHQMEKKGLFFATASGNVHQKLQEYFAEVDDRICYIADNGATVYIGKNKIFQSHLPMEKAEIVVQTMFNSPLFEGHRILVSSAEESFLLEDAEPDFRKDMKVYLTNIKYVRDFSEVKAPIIKVSMEVPHENTEAVEKLLNKIDGVVATTSGFTAIDVMNDKISKASGLKILQKELRLQDDEIASFGDNFNDLSMTLAVKQSYAMSNAVPLLKQAAYATIGSNEEQAVLDKIENLMKER